MLLTVKIRNAAPGDADQIYHLICQLEGKKMDKNFFEHVYSENLKSPTVFYWVIENSVEVLGFVSMHIQDLLHHERRIAEVQELCVDEKYRKLGFGKILLAQAEEEAKKQNCELIELAANRKREEAHRFYEREGWEKSHFKFTKKLG